MGLYMMDRIRAVNNSYGVDTRKQAQLNEIQRQLAIHFQDTPDYHGETLVEGKPQQLIVYKNRQDGTQKNIIAYPGETFLPGNVVDCFNTKWLITSVDPNQESYCRGIMERCNKELVWQNRHTGEIISRWCTAEKPYSSNLESNDLADVSVRQFKVQIPYDEETRDVGIDRRFMLEIIGGEPKTYRVVSVDTITERYEFNGEIIGFLVWNLQQDQYDKSKDNMDMMICDYFAPDEDTGTDEHGHVVDIEMTGEPVVKIGGRTKVLTGVIKDSDGNLLEETGKWSVSVADDVASYVTYKTDGSRFEIRAFDEPSLEGKHIKVEYGVQDNTISVLLEFIEVI